MVTRRVTLSHKKRSRRDDLFVTIRLRPGVHDELIERLHELERGERTRLVIEGLAWALNGQPDNLNPEQAIEAILARLQAHDEYLATLINETHLQREAMLQMATQFVDMSKRISRAGGQTPPALVELSDTPRLSAAEIAEREKQIDQW